MAIDQLRLLRVRDAVLVLDDGPKAEPLARGDAQKPATPGREDEVQAQLSVIASISVDQMRAVVERWAALPKTPGMWSEAIQLTIDPQAFMPARRSHGVMGTGQDEVERGPVFASLRLFTAQITLAPEEGPTANGVVLQTEGCRLSVPPDVRLRLRHPIDSFVEAVAGVQPSGMRSRWSLISASFTAEMLDLVR